MSATGSRSMVDRNPLCCGCSRRPGGQSEAQGIHPGPPGARSLTVSLMQPQNLAYAASLRFTNPQVRLDAVTVVGLPAAEPDIPKPPPGLKAAGKQLWTSFCATWVIDSAGLILLESAARSRDLEVRLQKVVDAADKLHCRGSRQNDVELPELASLFKARAQTASIIRQMALPPPEEEQQRKAESVSAAASRAARARWDRRYGG